jgi:hypothetical protein
VSGSPFGDDTDDTNNPDHDTWKMHLGGTKGPFEGSDSVSANRESGDLMIQLLIGAVLALLAVVSDQANLPVAALVFATLMVVWCAFEARFNR